MKTITTAVVALALACAAAAVAVPARADVLTGAERGQWVSQLRSLRGDRCCDDSDGEDTYWEASRDGTYRVFVLGAWVAVPGEALVAGPNLIGTARLWLQSAEYDERGALVAFSGVRCFLPGAAY
jgi:hypothetical protein